MKHDTRAEFEAQQSPSQSLAWYLDATGYAQRAFFELRKTYMCHRLCRQSSGRLRLAYAVSQPQNHRVRVVHFGLPNRIAKIRYCEVGQGSLHAADPSFSLSHVHEMHRLEHHGIASRKGCASTIHGKQSWRVSPEISPVLLACHWAHRGFPG